MDYPPVVGYIDITTSENTSDKSSFPSEEFGKFMDLTAKWNLSDACSNELLQFSKSIARKDVILPTSVKQGRKSLDQLTESHISFKKLPIMQYNEETYYLHYRQILDAIKELLSNNDIFYHCIFKFTPLNYEGQRIYSEQYNGKWWERTQNTLPDKANILSIILYSSLFNFGKYTFLEKK